MLLVAPGRRQVWERHVEPRIYSALQGHLDRNDCRCESVDVEVVGEELHVEHDFGCPLNPGPHAQARMWTDQ